MAAASKNKDQPEPIVNAEVLEESVLGWRPEDPYNPHDPDDFPAFEKWVLGQVSEIVTHHVGPPMPDNPSLVRQRARRALEASIVVSGMLTMAEDYLTAARKRATWLLNEDDASAPVMKDRRDGVVAAEKRLKEYLSRLRQDLQNTITFAMSDLKIIGVDIRAMGYEQKVREECPEDEEPGTPWNGKH